VQKKKGFGEHFHPETAFFDLPIIRLSLSIALIIIFGLVLTISVVDWRKPDWSADGFNELIIMFKLPIGLLAFFAALLALFATNHRSEQSRRSMELTQKSIEASGEQNRFANYYKHLEEFTKYLDFTIKKNQTNPVSVSERGLHQLFFPNAKAGDLSQPLEIEEGFVKIVNNFIQAFYLNPAMKQGHLESLRFLIIQQELELNHLFHEHVKFEEVNETYIKIDPDPPHFQKDDKESSYLVNHIRRLSFYLQILFFNTDYKYANLMSRMLDVALRCWKQRPDIDSENLKKQSAHYLSLKKALSKPIEELRLYVESLG
jgi:hypothetical protein